MYGFPLRPQIPSFNILTDGREYYFIRFVETPSPQLVRSRSFRINFSRGMPVTDLGQQLEALLRVLVGIFDAQKEAVKQVLGDEETSKRQRAA